MSYRLYYAEVRGGYKMLKECKSLKKLRDMVYELGKGKYLIILKSPNGDRVIDFEYIEPKTKKKKR